MAEMMKPRMSNWDVTAELNMEAVVHDSALPAKVDDSSMDLIGVDSIKPILSMNVDGSEINQSANQSGEERNNNTIISDDICVKIEYSEQLDPEGDCKEGLKKHDCEPAFQDRTMADYAENQDRPHKEPYDMFPGLQETHPMQLDPEGDCKDGLKKHDLEPAFQDRTMAEYAENQDIRHKEPYDMYPGLEERHPKQLDPEGDCEDGLKKHDLEQPAFQDRTMAEYAENQDIPHKEPYDMSPGLEERHPKQLDPEGDCKDGLKKLDCEPAFQDRIMAENAENQDRPHKEPYDMSPGLEERHSKQLDPEGDCKDGLKKHDCEPAFQDRTMAENAENQDRSHKEPYDMSPGLEERHPRNRNMSPIDDRSRPYRKRSRSLSHDSRNRSRSRSPSRSKQGSERWTDKGRMRGMTALCRDFAAGKCTKGSECRFLHEGAGSRQIDRHHHDAGLADGRGSSRLERERHPANDAGSADGRASSRLERERHLAYETKESITDTREKNDHTRDKPFRRHDEQFEDRGGNNVPHQGYRSNERCHDFSMGRCYRGAACRYIHGDALPDGGLSARDDSRGRVFERRGGFGNASFSHKPERQRLSDITCRYFLRGHCIHGAGCKFSHQAGPLSTPLKRSFDGGQSELRDQTTRIGAAGPRDENDSGAPDTQPIVKQNFSNRSMHDSHPALVQDARKGTQPFEKKTATPEVCEDLSANNPLPTISTAGQNAEKRGQTHFAPPFPQAHNFASTSSFQQFAPPLPLKGQMQQVLHSHPQNGKIPFPALHKPPDANMENLSAIPPSYQLNPQNLDPRLQGQQNLPVMPHGGSNINPNKPIQQNGPLIHNPHNQPDFGVGAQIQPNLASHIAHTNPAIIDAKNHLVVPQPSSNPQIFNSDEKNQAADSNPDNSITHKVVTSEQAAKITDLSASLAQFFGAGLTPPAFLNPSPIGPFVPAVAPLPVEVEGPQTNLAHLTPKPNQQVHAIDKINQADDSSSREAKKVEAHGIVDRDQSGPLQNGDAEGRKDADGKKLKEAKEFRMFKCSLVEFVKDILKPKWKEGQLSKEAYKTIVKKVVDKVCGSLQGSNAPQTQEKIDLYLLSSKAKLSKLVQAYVEKFVNS